MYNKKLPLNVLLIANFKLVGSLINLNNCAVGDLTYRGAPSISMLISAYENNDSINSEAVEKRMSAKRKKNLKKFYSYVLLSCLNTK